jgi:nucleoid-associated protein YgaU
MKFAKYIAVVASLLLFISASTFAQEMTKEEWQNEMTRQKAKLESLTKEVGTLQTDVTNLKNTKIQDYDDCVNEMYALVGATKADVDNFRKVVSELEGKINRKEGPKADRAQDVLALRQNKISALPEFFNKVNVELPKALDEWVEVATIKESDINYSVVKGDCLWRIAGKKQHYGNGFAWPKIYQANRDQIKNANLIFPKQNFKIPSLTQDEQVKYDKLKKNYKPAPVK